MKMAYLAGVGALGFVLAAGAADVGDPIFPKDMNRKARAEVIYDRISRDMDVDIGSNPAAKDKYEADVFMLRIHTDVEQNAYLDFDVGAIDPSGGGSGAFYGGVGLRLLVLDEARWRISGEVQGHYAPGLSGEVRGVESDYDVWNVDGALLLSGKFVVLNQLRLVPYAGPVLSAQRVDGDSTTGSDEAVSADEADLFGAVAGLSLLLPGNNSIRLEGRYFGDFEASVGAGIAF